MNLKINSFCYYCGLLQGPIESLLDKSRKVLKQAVGNYCIQPYMF